MKINVFLFIVAILITSCSSKMDIEKPANLIEHGKMTLILHDIHIADGLANRIGDPNNTTEPLAKEFYKSVFKKHNVTDEQFYSSFNYYIYESAELDSMYGGIINDISKDQAVTQGE